MIHRPDPHLWIFVTTALNYDTNLSGVFLCDKQMKPLATSLIAISDPVRLTESSVFL